MKRLLKIISFILVLCLFLTACSVKKVDNQGYQQNSKKLEDLNFLCDTLESKHKDLYANISKEDFLKEKNRLVELTSTMSDSDYYFSLKHLISLIGDSHTSIDYSDSYYKHLSALAFAFNKFDDSWRLVVLEKENEEYLGTKLIAINDMPLNDIYEKAKSVMSFDNLVWAESQFSNTINFKEPLEYLGVVKNNEPITLTIKKDDETEHKITIKPLSESEVMSIELVRLKQKVLPITAPSDYYRVLPINKDNLFIQYNLCQEDSNLPMKKFVENVKKDLMDNDYKSVIIDLRYNPGGNSGIFEPMIDVLKDIKKSKEIQVYTLIGKNTFSSGIINAVQTKKELNSILVGTPTGGSVNHFGEVKTFNLKNFPITISYSIKYFTMISNYENDSLYPDVEVIQTLDDYVSGIDAEVEWIIKR